MGRSFDSDYEDSYETYNIISQMKKLKPTELKNLFEAMVNSLTIPTKEGLVFLVWEGLEPHERDLFNFPSNDIYSDTIKESYLEIFQHNQPLSSIWNNNDILRRNRIRTRNIYANQNDDMDSYTRRRLDFTSIIDRLFDTESAMNIIPGSMDSLDSLSSITSDTSDSDTSTDTSNSDNSSNHSGDNVAETNIIDTLLNRNNANNTISDNIRRIRAHRNPPALTRRQLLRRHERISSPVITLPSSITEFPVYQPLRIPNLTSNSNSSGVTSTRFVSTERRTVTVNNNDIRTLHIVSRHRPESREETRSNSDEDSDDSSDNNRTNTNTNSNHDSNSNSSSENVHTIRLSASSVNQHPLTNNNYVYTTSTEPVNVLRLPLNNSNNSNNETTNDTNTSTSSLSTVDRTTTTANS